MKASVFVGTSLDGFIARTNGSFDFLPPGGGEPHGYDEFMATVDALVIGRNTFETVLTLPSWPYGGKNVFVLSTRELPPVPVGAVVERMAGDPSDIVSRLSARGVRHIYVDGGITIQRFLRAGLIQRLTITRVPVLIGSGIPLFGVIERDLLLRHVATRQYASGLVQSEYEVVARNEMNDAPLLRDAVPEDAPVIGALLGELGHPLAPEGVALQLRQISAFGNGYFVIVAVSKQRVVGAVSGFATPVLHREASVGRLSVLVVAHSHAGQGIGSLLVRAAEERFRAQGCGRVEVTSAGHRSEAHEFYRRKGYRQQGVRFAREL